MDIQKRMDELVTLLNEANYRYYVLDDPKMLKIYDYAFEKGLIIIHHAGFDPAFPPPYRSSPKQFANIIKEMRGGVLVAAHLGGERQWDEVEEYMVGKNVYLDTSMGSNYYPKEQLVRIIKNHGSDKILFGSDSPWSRADEEIAFIRGLDISEEEKENILFKNAKRLLGI
jgi:predicted TIM-barrel fold metal-dependent hydrolase